MPSSRSDKQAIERAQAFAYPRRAELRAEADMVMKGGITSGIVYPLAVCEIAKKYQLRNVGGSSAGGIAAAFAAAAEHDRDGGGYGKLAGLPARLGGDLSALFQPSEETAPAFGLLSAWIDRRSPRWRRVPTAVWRLAGASGGLFFVVLVAVLVPETLLLVAATGGGPYDVRR